MGTAVVLLLITSPFLAAAWVAQGFRSLPEPEPRKRNVSPGDRLDRSSPVARPRLVSPPPFTQRRPEGAEAWDTDTWIPD